MRKALLIAVFLGLGGGVAAAPAVEAVKKPGKRAPAQSQRAAVENLLRASAAAPTAPELARLGRAVDETLIAIARDPAVDLPIRARAVGALVNTPSTAAHTFLRELVERPEKTLSPARGKAPKPDAGAADAGAGPEKRAEAAAQQVLLRRAAVALGWLGGPRVVMALGPLLDHPDPEIRADATLGLALTRSPEAAQRLRTRLPKETDPRVRGHIARQINVIEAATGGTPPPPPPPPKIPGPTPRGEF